MSWQLFGFFIVTHCSCVSGNNLGVEWRDVVMNASMLLCVSECEWMEVDSNTCIKLLELLSKVMKKCELDNIIMGILAWRRSLLSFLFFKDNLQYRPGVGFTRSCFLWNGMYKKINSQILINTKITVALDTLRQQYWKHCCLCLLLLTQLQSAAAHRQTHSCSHHWSSWHPRHYTRNIKRS